MFEQLHPALRKPVITFMIALASCIVLLYISDAYLTDASEGELGAKRAMRLWKNKIDGSRRNNEILDTYESAYLSLVKENIINNENRLSWYETIQATSESRGMPSIRYSVAEQTKVTDNALNSFPGINVYKSTMALDMKMNHEGDLFALFNNLESSAKGLFAVEGCIVDKPFQAKEMKASCTLNWYTIRSDEQLAGK